MSVKGVKGCVKGVKLCKLLISKAVLSVLRVLRASPVCAGARAHTHMRTCAHAHINTLNTLNTLNINS